MLDHVTSSHVNQYVYPEVSVMNRFCTSVGWHEIQIQSNFPNVTAKM